MNPDEIKLNQAREVIRDASSVFVITGAGISAESGVPTFRGAGGLWKDFDPTKVATPEAFEENPAFVWEWYNSRRADLAPRVPNAGHEALVRLEKSRPDFFLLTQNVDDLHEQAGTETLAHIHGRIWDMRCVSCGDVHEDRTPSLPELPPCCNQCSGLLRPDVVWFGEMIKEHAIQATEAFLAQREIDAVLVIGTEAHFGYIAHWALAARGRNGILIEINTDATAFSDAADLTLRGPAGTILPTLLA